MRLIDADKIDYRKYHLGRGYTWDECEKVAEVVHEQPTVSQWIPCSERLPDKNGWYLCSYESRLVQKCLFYCDEWQDDNADVNRILAWMPLPEPYRERKVVNMDFRQNLTDFCRKMLNCQSCPIQRICDNVCGYDSFVDVGDEEIEEMRHRIEDLHDTLGELLE